MGISWNFPLERTILARGRSLEEEFFTGHGKAKRVALGVNFARPKLKTSRPLSSRGAQSFHFSHRFITKSEAATLTAIPNSSRKSGRAAAHARYIERENSLEAISPAMRNEAYIERPGAVEEIGTPTDMSEPALASFGNIGATLAERVAFWKHVEEAERSPGHDRLRLDLSNPEARAWWDRLIADPACPDCLRRLNLRKTALAFPLSPEDMAKARSHLDRHSREFDGPAPYRINPGRGGRIQNRIIAELPHEISPAKRLAILKGFCAEFEALGLPYWAVIHAPDAHNDRRNFHAHIAYYDRPCRRLPDGRWDFAVAERHRDPYGRERVRYPYRREKLRAANGQDWIDHLRRNWAKISNEILAAAGVEKRYDPRSYRKMGIARQPTAHLGTKAAALEARGEPTKTGLANAERQFADEFARLQRDFASRMSEITERFEQEKIRAQQQIRNHPQSSGAMVQSFARYSAALTARQSIEIEICRADHADALLALEVARRTQRAQDAREAAIREIAGAPGRSLKAHAVLEASENYLREANLSFSSLRSGIRSESEAGKPLLLKLKAAGAEVGAARQEFEGQSAEAAIAYAAQRRLRVKPTSSGRFSIAGLDREMAIPALDSPRMQRRLSAIADSQNHEIARFLAWLEKHPGDYRVTSEGFDFVAAPKAVRTLARHWANEAEIRTALAVKSDPDTDKIKSERRRIEAEIRNRDRQRTR